MGILAKLFGSDYARQSANYMNSLTGDKGDNFADNPYLADYEKDLLKNEQKLLKNKPFDMKKLYSERYVQNKDLGQPTTKKPEGWTGLNTRKEMEKSGMSTKGLNVSSADIQSTAIGRIRYNPKSTNLYITFRNGDKEYLFPGVEKEKVLQMAKAPSKGEFYHEKIKPYAVSKNQALNIKQAWKNK